MALAICSGCGGGQGQNNSNNSDAGTESELVSGEMSSWPEMESEVSDSVSFAADSSVVSKITSKAAGSSGIKSSAAVSSEESYTRIYKPETKMDQTIYNIGMCVTDLSAENDTAEVVRKRHELYKDFGLKTIRLATLWGAVEQREGVFNNPPDQVHLNWIKQNGMRLKLIIGAISVIPGWYLSRNPNATLVNDAGVKAASSVNYLLPGLHDKIEKAVDGIMKYYTETGLISIVDSIVVDMGPAGEPLYPPAWTQNPDWLTTDSGPEHFWCYDAMMQADFRKVMQAKYKTIAAANKAWGQSYASFDSLAVPKPGTVKGTMWNDVLTWYRQVKRDFMEQNVITYKKVVDKYTKGRVKLILYIPGRDVRDEEWQQAVESGEGSDMVKLMADSRHVIDLAKKYGCYLQSTGAEGEGELRYIRYYMEKIGCGNIPLFGENSGGYNVGKNMKSYVSVLRRNGLAGIDITHDQWIRAADRFSPNEDYATIKENLGILSDYLKSAIK